MIFRILAAAVLSSACHIAHADTYQFAFTGDAEPNPYGIPVPPTETLSFQLSGLPVYYQVSENPDISEYEYPSVPVSSSNFSYQLDASVVLSSNPGSVTEPQDADLLNGPGDPYGIGYLHFETPFYTGPESNPTLLPGTYAAQFETHDTREL